jgi:hypothetical protein
MGRAQSRVVGAAAIVVAIGTAGAVSITSGAVTRQAGARATAAPRRDGGPVRVSGRTGRSRGSAGEGRPLRRQIRRRARARNPRVEPGEGQINPPGRRLPQRHPPAGAHGPPTGPPAPALAGDPRGSPTPPPHPPLPPQASSSSSAGPPAARAAAANDFTVLGGQPFSFGSLAETGEPSFANDGSAILFTYNSYAAVSQDNGLNWDPVDPAQFHGRRGGIVCCDQVAYAVDRGPYSLIFWLVQHYAPENPQHTGDGPLTLAIYRGRDDLIDQRYCLMEFAPSDFGKGPNGWFDFNHISATDKFLYIGSDAHTTDPARDALSDGVVWRMSLDQIDAYTAADCQIAPPTTRSWSGTATGTHQALVEGPPGGTGDRMHWASLSGTDALTITRVLDDETRASVYTRSVSPFQSTARGSARCVVPGGTNPCEHLDSGPMVGYSTGTELGWLWMVRQSIGSGQTFPFPFIRVARFNQALARIGEHDIWDRNSAWIYPSVGVNSRRQVGLTAYNAGPHQFPSPSAAALDDVTPSWDAVRFTTIASSGAGTDVQGEGVWGDYGQVRAYNGCDRTWGGSAYTVRGPNTGQGVEFRFAWFGRERDGCPDLSVVSLGVLPTAARPGDTLYVGETTRNIGSGLAGGSTTRYYLSRDAGAKTRDDLLLGDATTVPQLGAGASNGQLNGVTMPFIADGTYFLLACADGLEQVAEITEDDNCLVADQTVTSTLSAMPQPSAIDLDNPTGSTTAGGPAPMRAEVEIDLSAGPRAPQTLRFYMSRTPSATGRAVRLGQATFQPRAATAGRAVPAASAARRSVRRIVVRRTVRVPRSLRPRRYFLLACLGSRPSADRCAVSRRAIRVHSARSTRRAG